MTDQADAEARASADHWQTLLEAQGVGVTEEALRRRLEDLLVEIREMVRPFKDDGGYSARVYALVTKRAGELADEYGQIIGDHPLYDAASLDRRSS